MSGLGKLIALQRQAKKDDSNEVLPVDGTDGVKAGPEIKDSGSHDSSEPAKIPQPNRAVAAPKTGFKFGAGNKSRPDSGSPARAPASQSGSVSPDTSDSIYDGSVELSLDDLAGLDETVTPAIVKTSVFIDEIEATAPERALPEDVTAEQISFIESLDNLYTVVNDTELLGQSVRLIMMELQEKPEYMKLVNDQDVHTLILAARNVMGLARIRKQEKSRKTPAGGRKSKSKDISDDDLELLNSMGFGDD